MSAVVVHFIKHWDNDTKGSIEFIGVRDLIDAIEKTRGQLAHELLEEAVQEGSTVFERSFDENLTITKAELIDDEAIWFGVPKGA